jgi:PAS domain S-box-containing protein
VILVGEDQRIMSWNEAAADLFGVPAAQALGQPAADVVGQPRTVTGLGRETLAALVAAEGGWFGSLLWRRRDGSEFLLQATGLRVPLERGTGILWISHRPGQCGGTRTGRTPPGPRPGWRPAGPQCPRAAGS